MLLAVAVSAAGFGYGKAANISMSMGLPIVLFTAYRAATHRPSAASGPPAPRVPVSEEVSSR
ncbi:hypothetical protein ADK59_21485 [Streptomyces sp. XY332]|nr:hypothetical protein ADK59_21485 [Streptomyces sp. XY332]